MLVVDKSLLEKLPKYAQDWNWSVLQRSAFGGTKIDAIHFALPGDPHKDDEPEVVYICDSFVEFIWYVRKYNKDYRRMN